MLLVMNFPHAVTMLAKAVMLRYMNILHKSFHWLDCMGMDAFIGRSAIK